MNVLLSFFNRLRFRRHTKDESANVVDSIVKARKLYKELSVIAHPDRNPKQADIAEELMKRIVENRSNYAALVKLKMEVNEKLLNT